jgi:hypothetical protein
VQTSHQLRRSGDRFLARLRSNAVTNRRTDDASGQDTASRALPSLSWLACATTWKAVGDSGSGSESTIARSSVSC